jgi:MFS superfamily sulfate permease-like transporter
MLNYDVPTERDLVPGFLTLIACLALGVELGIVIGVAVDIAFLLYFSARPGIKVERLQVGVDHIVSADNTQAIRMNYITRFSTVRSP